MAAEEGRNYLVQFSPNLVDWLTIDRFTANERKQQSIEFTLEDEVAKFGRIVKLGVNK